jgi:hypothetical protein
MASLQNGITAAISSTLLKGRPVIYTRCVVVGISSLLILIASLGTANVIPNWGNVIDVRRNLPCQHLHTSTCLHICRYPPKPVPSLLPTCSWPRSPPICLQLFLLANMMCSTSAFPLMLGLSERLHKVYGGFSMLASCFVSFVCTSVFGVAYAKDNGLSYSNADYSVTTVVWQDGASLASNINRGMYYTWLKNLYNYKYFLVGGRRVVRVWARGATAAGRGIECPVPPAPAAWPGPWKSLPSWELGWECAMPCSRFRRPAAGLGGRFHCHAPLDDCGQLGVEQGARRAGDRDLGLHLCCRQPAPARV